MLSKEKWPKVAIIVLNWNGWRDTIECLESLYQITYPDYEVIVVDNGSEDESIEKIREYCKGKIQVKSKLIPMMAYPNKPIEIIEYTRDEAEVICRVDKEIDELPSNKKIIIIKNEKNYGYAEGNNIAMRYALIALQHDYLLLLNNDTVVDKDFLSEAVRIAERNRKIGIVGPKVYYYDFKGRTDIINFAGGKLDIWKGEPNHIGINEVDKGQFDEIKAVDYIEGSALLIKKDVLNKIGLIDPIYFAYWEENDLCMRVFNAGNLCVYAPGSKIWHKISASIENNKKIYYYNRNRFIFMRKYSNKLQCAIFFIYFFGFEFWRTSCIYLLYHRNIKKFSYFLKGILYGICSPIEHT